MDNNNPTQPVGTGTPPNPQPLTPTTDPTPAAQPVTATPQSAGPTPSVIPNAGAQPAATGGGGSKKMIFIVVGLIALVAVFAGVYFYMSKPAAPTAQTQTTTVAPADTLDEDLESITVEQLDADFASVDTDVQSL